MIRCWGGVGDSGQAQEVFDEMLERGHTADLLTWNSVLHSLCKGGKVDEAYELFRGMRQKGFEPDSYSYSIFIHGSCDANDIHTAFRVLDSMRRYNLVPNVFTYNCIIKKLCKNDKINEAYELLDKMLERGVKPDTWSYSTILAFHCDHTEVNRALKLILSMDRDKCERDSHTYNMVLKMLNHLYEKYRDQGLEILAFPCNQFVEEEPGSNDQILDFVCTRLKSEFSIFGKIELNGDNAAPLYKFLKSGKWGIFGNDIKWNFANFLVDKNGQPVGRYYPTTSPLTIEMLFISGIYQS